MPTQPSLGGVPNSIIDGRNLWVDGNGKLRSAKGMASFGSSGSANPLMNVGSGYGGLTGNGTIIQYINTYWFAGSGTATVNGSSIGSTSNQLMLVVGGSAVAAGLAAPGAPVISVAATTGKNEGSYSILLTAVRQTTGAESSRGAVSNVVSATQKKIRIDTFPSPPTGTTHWGVYCSKHGFGATGPWYWLRDIPVGTAAGYELDWYDGDLSRVAPLDYDPPPPCTHVFAIDNIMVAAGCEGGYGLAPSVPGKPEAFPPDTYTYLSRGEAITACKGSGFDGRVFVACANSFHEVVRSGSTVAPIIPRPMWPATGFTGPSSWCVVEGAIFGLTAGRGAVRGMGEEIDTSFANDVQDFFSRNGFTSANTTVGFDPKNNAIIFMSGSLAVPYMRSKGVWSTPITIPGATTCVTVGERLLVANGATLYEFEGGSGGTFYAVPAFSDGGKPEYMKTVVGMRGASDVSMQLDLLTDLDLTTSRATKTSAPNHGRWHRLNTRKAESFTVKASGTGADKTIHEIALQFIPHEVRAG